MSARSRWWDLRVEVLESVAAGPSGWPPAHDVLDATYPPLRRFVHLFRFYPIRRVWWRRVSCRQEHVGPLHDAHICLKCGTDLLEGSRSTPPSERSAP